ncbi:MAG: pilus assembly protein PilM, partial [Candidatus Binatia bacterium]
VRGIHARRQGRDLVIDGYRLARVDAQRSLEDACRDVLSLRLGNEAVAIAVASPEAAIRQAEMPPMTPREIQEALPWEARRHIAGLDDDAVLDVQVLDRSEPGPMNVLIVAFPRRLYDDLASLWTSLGIDPAFVDLAPLGVMNAARDEQSVAPQAILDLGTGTGSFSISSPNGILLFRDLAPRVSRLDSLLGTAFSLNEEAVEALKRNGKLPSTPAPPKAALEKAIGEVTGELGEDLRAGVLYLENRTGGAIDRVLLTGTTAHFLERHGLTDAIASASGLAFERLNPFRRFRLGLVDEIGLKGNAFDLAAAAGVAARQLTS